MYCADIRSKVLLWVVDSFENKVWGYDTTNLHMRIHEYVYLGLTTMIL